jgi:hypothetical protein
MIRLLLLACLLSLPARAAEPIVVNNAERQTAVVELYTSEGCSSCPPADRWLSRLVQTPADELQVLALSFHVDYWNYLGWKDRFSSSLYTSRQRQLGANNRQRTIYTPEFFVNGMEARGTGNILSKIEQVNAEPAPLDLELSVSRDQTGLVLDLHALKDGVGGPLHHRYLVYENNLSTDVKRGENAGETLRHQRVVRYMSRAHVLRGENRHRIAIDPQWNGENVGVAVLVTSPGSLQYLDALHTPVAPLLARAAAAN